MGEGMIWTGEYAVAHFGTPDAPTSRPCFKIAEGKGDTRKFTVGLARAEFYSTRISAELAMNAENEYLEGINHPLAGRLCIVEIYAKKVEG